MLKSEFTASTYSKIWKSLTSASGCAILISITLAWSVLVCYVLLWNDVSDNITLLWNGPLGFHSKCRQQVIREDSHHHGSSILQKIWMQLNKVIGFPFSAKPTQYIKTIYFYWSVQQRNSKTFNNAGTPVKVCSRRHRLSGRYTLIITTYKALGMNTNLCMYTQWPLY